MQAIANSGYGGAEVTSIIELPVPTPAEGEVQIRVAGGGLNPVDLRLREGALKALLPLPLPFVVGNELSGEISALGAGVTSLAVGDKVIVRVSKTGGTGAFSQYVVQPANLVARAPTNISLVDAAGLPLAGLTALQVLDKLGVKAGDKVLITAGAGGVGLLAIQLAKIRGAHVTTTASSAGEELVRSVGADVVVDYKTTKLADLDTKFTQVFDCAGGDMTDVLAATADNGRVITIAGTPTPSMLDSFDLPSWKRYLVSGAIWLQSRSVRNAASARGIAYEFLFMRPDGPELQQLSDYVTAGKLRVVIDSTFKFADYADALARLESKRSKGKVVIEFPATA